MKPRPIALALVALAVGLGGCLTGCLTHDVDFCDDGTVCPDGQVCAPGGGCTSQVDEDACVGKVDGEDCDGDFGAGQCSGGTCRNVRCGDGRLDPGEVCDDGNAVDGDGCARDCGSDETCGNATRDTGEACDDGPTGSTTCTPACTLARCGDGVVDQGEVCDDGNTASADGCAGNCASDETCGNGTRDVGEACDDGNLVDGDGCQATCSLPACGDGVVDFGEACDDGGTASGDGCDETCTSDETCGNGVTDFGLGEECDDGNTVDHDGCQGTCVVQRCGDGVADSDEACDDGNLVSGDGCSSDCGSDETCGNERLDPSIGEQCDSGAGQSHDGCTSVCTVELELWSPDVDETVGRSGVMMVYDTARARAVLFGGSTQFDFYREYDGTWEDDGNGWSRQPLYTVPHSRVDGMMVYDAGRHRAVLFGGVSYTNNDEVWFDDTWEYDGVRWQQRAPATSPLPDYAEAMAYDAGRARTVLVERLDDTVTWEYDGTTWTAGIAAPSVGVMEYDPGTAAIVGTDGSSTWIYDGATWTQLPTGTTPSAVHSMAYDADRGDLIALSGNPMTVWDFDGASWTQRTTGAAPTPTYDDLVVHDAAHHRLLVRIGADATTSATWGLDDADWTELDEPVLPDLELAGPAFDAARGTMVVLDDARQTWEYDGTRWRLRQDVEVPAMASFYDGSLAYDDARQRVIGYDGAALWEYDGLAWSERPVMAAGPATYGGDFLAYDRARACVVMFGGASDGDGAQTWELCDDAWAQVAPDASPPPLWMDGLVYDAAAARVVLVGQDGTTNPTWTYDGATWTELPSTPTPYRTAPAITYDPVRQRVVLVGGYGPATPLSDTWELDGDTWVARTPASTPTARGGATLGYDALRQRLVLTAGYASDDYVHDRWTDEFTNAEDAPDRCDGDADTDGDGLIGCDDPDCWGYCTPHCPPGTACDATLPSCGDDVCNPWLEDYLLCPGDCAAP